MVDISIIIPACNEEKCIQDTLNSIKNQNSPSYEVVVVCNGCTDKTKEKVEELGYKTLNLDERHVSKARNLGVKNANGKKLIFLDADTQLSENSLEVIFNSYDLGTTKIKPDVNKLVAKAFMKVKNLFWWTYWSNGIVFCDKDIFDKINGFNEDKRKGEDKDFLKRASEHGKFGIANTYVINSMRRPEKWGYFKWVFFWIREGLFPSKKEYELVR